MIVHDVRQGSLQWQQLRLGIPTASNFDRIVTPKGALSAGRDKYMTELLAELCLGRPLQSVTTALMERGVDLEESAVSYYTLQTDTPEEDIKRVGFITDDRGRYGASPDRLVGAKGLLEIKCPKPELHMHYLLHGEVPEAYRAQVYGQLWIAEREWSHFVSFHEELPTCIVKAERDEAYIKLLDKAVNAFCDELEAKKQLLIERGYWSPKAEEPIDPMMFDVTDEDVDRMLAGRGGTV